MGDILGIFEIPARFKVGKDGLAGFHRGHARIFAAVEHLRLVGAGAAAVLQLLPGGAVRRAGHAAVIGQHAHHRQVVALANLKVVGVMRRGDLDDTGPLFHVGVFVADDGISLFSSGSTTWQPCRWA